jgi:hypothetical protein
MRVRDFDVHFFALFGYTVLREVLTAAECRAISGEFARAFRTAFTDLTARTTPAWLPGLADATPTSAALTVDDDRLWGIARRLLGCDALPCPPEVAWLRGLTPWHYDDPLGLRGVKFLVYVTGPADGLRLLPMSHRDPEAVRTLVAEPRHLPAVPVSVAPGDVVAIDLHVWHAYQVRGPRILWAPEYLAWPVDPAATAALPAKFAALADAGAPEDGRTAWPVWDEWLRAPTGRRRDAVTLLRSAGAFDNGWGLR